MRAKVPTWEIAFPNSLDSATKWHEIFTKRQAQDKSNGVT